MNEKIGEGIENKEIKKEIEIDKEVVDFKEIKEVGDISQGKAVLEKIHNQVSPKNDKKEQPVIIDDKQTEMLVKESQFGLGMEKVIKIIKKMNCFIGKKARILDDVHDKYTQENNKKDKQP